MARKGLHGPGRSTNGPYPTVKIGPGKRDYELEHRVVAARALGKPLPLGVEVHHVNGDKKDPRAGNLVICQDRAYHNLLHRRERAYRATGHADWIKCCCCRQYDAPAAMKVYERKDRNGFTAYHLACMLERQRTRKRAA